MEFPHDINGIYASLGVLQGYLYTKSTGKKWMSSLRKIDFETGKILQQINLEENLCLGREFTILNDKIYMLTWQSNIGFIYDTKTIEKEIVSNYGKG